MAATGTPTPNLGLRIPLGTDPADVADINANSNTLDTVIGNPEELETTEQGSLVGAINELNENKVNKSDIVNNLTSGGTTKVLSAEQGKFLYNNTAMGAAINTFLPTIISVTTNAYRKIILTPKNGYTMAGRTGFFIFGGAYGTGTLEMALYTRSAGILNLTQSPLDIETTDNSITITDAGIYSDYIIIPFFTPLNATLGN